MHMSNDLDFGALIPRKLARTSIFRQPGWCVWDPCIVQGEEGTFHLFYSRWPTQLGFESWCTHAEIAWATATSASGPYEFRGIALPARGMNYWDGHSVYNTCVIRTGSKFYIYYTGNHGTDRWDPVRGISPFSEEWWCYRNHQRIGVAVADSLYGPWQRFDKPLLDVSPDFGNTIIGVPNMVIKPDGGYRIYYKTLADGSGNFGGGVFHYSVDAPDPLGPFTRNPEPMVDKNRLLPGISEPFSFHIDDHFEWFQNERYWAIVKDHDAPFLTAYGRALLLFESLDGRKWQPARHVLVQDFAVIWEDNTREQFERLEMPKLFFDYGRPAILSLAALAEGGSESFLLIIPLRT